ncbi:hypothetical protein NVV94_16985 [Pseudomonas sp. LS1212]|uniref:hypothetical protein n=1 Tax=Pseudomonas sp. LS1212 TaxID=2972478 RepID=UPI00215C351C|nr:hypothetical protein [Pseudomonas sp. LS1212]UVJ42329.1 hypothetical protein NVV94_16985 [Pseudomonas sp. LS1212]
MLIRSLLGLLALLSCAAHALQTPAASDATLLKLAATLEKTAGNSQWQQLWSRSRQAGHLEANPTQPYFTAPMREIPALVSKTLNQAQSVEALKQTQALYRHDFSPRVVGQQGSLALTAVCLWVDWRTLPENPSVNEQSSMQQVGLLLTRPCR